jgi:hypothetical protein
MNTTVVALFWRTTVATSASMLCGGAVWGTLKSELYGESYDEKIGDMEAQEYPRDVAVVDGVDWTQW